MVAIMVGLSFFLEKVHKEVKSSLIMLYAIAHFLRDKCPFIWDMIDIVNAWLFSMRYGKKLKAIESGILEQYAKECCMKVVPMCEVPTEQLVAFFAAQPGEAYTFFKPHGFDGKSIKKLQRNRSFLAYILMDSNSSNLSDSSNRPAIAGYCFIRSFFHGKGFRGRMVGIDHRGRGLGTKMNRLMNDVGFGIGLRLFETVSKDNVASYRSALSSSNVKVVEEMPHNEVYLEILND